MPRSQINENQVKDSDFLSEQEHVDIGDGSPHHARGHSMHDTADHTDVDGAPGNQSTFYHRTSDNKWAIRKNNLASSPPTVNDDDTQGYVQWSRWLDTTAQIEWVCMSNATGAALWIQSSFSEDFIRSLSKTLQYGFSDNNNPFVEKNSTNWTTVGSFMFLGTDIFTPTSWFITVGRPGTAGTAEARLVDIFASPVPLVISTITWTLADVAVQPSPVALINFPTGQTVIDIQIRKQTSQSKAARIYHSVLE